MFASGEMRTSAWEADISTDKRWMNAGNIALAGRCITQLTLVVAPIAIRMLKYIAEIFYDNDNTMMSLYDDGDEI